MALFQSTSNLAATSNTYAALTNEVAAANGYSTGGVAVTVSMSGTTTVTVTSTTPTWTASVGSIVARYAVVYQIAGNILCYCTLDSTPADVTTAAGNTLSIAPSGTGLFGLS